MNYLHEDLSYKIIGVLYKVHNTLGFGYKEKDYQRAIAVEFDSLKIPYERELYSKLEYNNQRISNYYLDFLIDSSIILEVKVANEIYRNHFNQVLQYLTNNELELGIIGAFTPDKVLVKRVINQKGSRNTDSSAKSV